MMSASHMSFETVIDGITASQFRLLTKMRRKRELQEKRWQLQVASFTIQSKEQGESWVELMEALADEDEPQADMGGGFTVSTKHPLLHEISEQQVALARMSPKPGLLGKIRFSKVQE